MNNAKFKNMEHAKLPLMQKIILDTIELSKFADSIGLSDFEICQAMDASLSKWFALTEVTDELSEAYQEAIDNPHLIKKEAQQENDER